MPPLPGFRPTRRLLVLAAAVLLLVARAGAQCGTGSTRAFDAFTVTPVSLTLAPVGVTEFDRGWSEAAQYTVTVDPTNGNRNRDWFVCLQAATAAFPAVSGYAKPAPDLEWSLDGTTWAATTVAMQQVNGPRRGLLSFSVYVRLRVDYGFDVPGSYGPLPLTFWVSH